MPAPLFQHRHYRKIAEMVATIRGIDGAMRNHIANSIAWDLRGTNPNFDLERFLAAAMGEPINGRDGRRQRQPREFVVGDIVAPNFSNEACQRAIRWRASERYPAWDSNTRLRVVEVYSPRAPTIRVTPAHGEWTYGINSDGTETWDRECFVHAEPINLGTEIDEE